MRITRISLQNFRAFDEPFELDLDGGKNLLLHGENGAGKSSLYFALKRFFEERGDAIENHRNHFAPATRAGYVRLRLKGIDSTGTPHDREFYWDEQDGHPLTIPKDPTTVPISPELRSLLVDGARRAGFMDYRIMLRTNLLSAPLSRSSYGPRIHDTIYGAESKGLEAQLFDLVSLSILAGVRVPTAGGESTIGALMRKVWENRPTSRYKRTLKSANAVANAFNQAFNALLPKLELKLSEFLNHFENHCLTIKLQPVSLFWDKPSLELKGADLIPVITFRGKPVRDHHLFLNEARLSALGTCLFLAGVLLSDNDYTNSAYPRFLVLDDALIGLELQNRLPVLRILTSEAFKNYQIFLLTHDRVWFDLARGHLREKDGWLHRELLADEQSGKLIPRQKPSQSDLQRAQTHLNNGDLMAAAVYTRAAFEWKLRNVCEDRGIDVKFKKENKEISADDLWQGIVNRQRKREELQKTKLGVPDFLPNQMEKDVEAMRSTVLNQLSHSGAPGLVRDDLRDAWRTVESLHNHHFPKV
jgi:energy-coupling factor transporter ATP-binding protein EcfA2